MGRRFSLRGEEAARLPAWDLGFPLSGPLGLAKPAKTPYHDDQGMSGPGSFVVLHHAALRKYFQVRRMVFQGIKSVGCVLRTILSWVR
jgi:hypothetical protein